MSVENCCNYLIAIDVFYSTVAFVELLNQMNLLCVLRLIEGMEISQSVLLTAATILFNIVL